MGAMWAWITAHWDEEWARFAEGVLLLLLSFVIASLVRGALRKQLTRPHIDPQVALLVSRIAYLATVLLGLIAFFTRWFGSPALVFGGFGFLALAISLAFQDILKNFIAGIFMLLERPFRLGDEITVDNHTGIVENIEMRATTLRTSEGEQVITPNSLVYTGTIINRTRYPTRLFTLTAKVPAGAALDGLAERVEEQLKSRPDIAKDPPPRVGLQPSLDGGLTLEVRYWLDYRRNDPLVVQAAVGRQIYQAIQPATEPTSTAPSRAAGT
ncbi:MAG: mechanosensitive ion channel family protein [Chloroflexi bacterium]|nr:MAG: mechanosensitive ion channel family protein [Chloroflexota bacterium]TMD65848.1 MAG: mechanosensitive ion channel family protein [Chloroflexota bacterium]